MKGFYEFYAKQVVFLTGATGGLGGCLLYKLSLVLHAQRLYVLVRGSEERALERWRNTMPDQFHDIEAQVRAGNVIIVPGDMTKDDFGIARETLRAIEKEVTLLIHAAGNISLFDPLRKIVPDNCVSTLRLAEMATKMVLLQHFVPISSAYANSFLPDGPVEERVYYLSCPDDAEGELREIQETGTTRYLQGFPWAYAYSKQLMERLLVARFPNLPILIVRPTVIGPAIAQPYELYGPNGSCPISTLYARLMMPNGGQSVWHSAARGGNVLDEVPVDLVANILLQHVHAGTRGVVHASSSYYIPKTSRSLLEQPLRFVPKEWAARMARPVFIDDQTVKQCKEAEFYKMVGRAWNFRAPSSGRLMTLKGPLVSGIAGHDFDRFSEQRVKLIFDEVKLCVHSQDNADSRVLSRL